MNDEINTALVKKPQCKDCRFYDGFGSCSKHGYQLRDNCEDYADMETIHKYVEDMENYEKKYTQALERAKEFLQDGTITTVKKDYIWEIFPELEVSEVGEVNEDERIRKGLINGFKECLEDCQYPKNAVKYWHDVEVDSILAWLEKQGEQPTNKIEPKFKVGDWIIDEETPNDVFYVIGVLEEIYKVIDIDGQDYHIPHCKADKQFHLWSIDDAKDGDVLETDGSVFIYAKVLYNKPYAYCGVDKYGVFKDNCLENNWSNSVYNIHPATDKQRDQLEKAIMKAGYEWDSEKKELKKIEVASKEMEDERIRKGIIRNLKYLMDRSEGFVKEDLQERIAWLEKQGEQTKEWSNDDKRMLRELCRTIWNYIPYDEAQEYVIWLQKQCVQKNTRKREIDDAYLQGICDAKHIIEKQSKKLDADEVFQWLCNYNSTLFGAKWCKTENIIEQFRKDFGL